MVKIVSVLIPTCNRQILAIKAIKSALAQTYRNIEIVVTDNSKTTDLSEMLSSIDDNRIRYFKNCNNIGPILNWRKALELSIGDYCLILPDDDYLLNPFYIEEAVHLIEAYQVSMVIPSCILNYPNDKLVGKIGYSGKINGRKFIEAGYHIPHIGNIFLRELALRANAFHTNSILWSDMELWWKLMSDTDVYCYVEPSISYTFHDKNIVFNMNKLQLIENSIFIRNSVSSYADDKLIAKLLIRYLLMINSFGSRVDFELIRKSIELNKINSNFLYIVIVFFISQAKGEFKSIIKLILKKLFKKI